MGSAEKPLRHLYRRLTAGDDSHPLIVPARTVVRWTLVLYQQLERDRAFVRASGMAYISLISFVPLLLLGFTSLGALGLVDTDGERILAVLDETFPSLKVLLSVTGIELEKIMKADLRPLGLVGGAALLVVTARLFLMVERAYNDIFGVHVDRGLGRRLLNFYFTLTALPAVLAVSLLGTDNVMSRLGLHAISQWITSVTVFGLLLAALKLLPCTRVRWRAALTGAGVSWLLLEGGGRLYPLYLGWWMGSDDPVRGFYGSLSAVPVFLLWLYMLWLFALLGVEVAYVVQNFQSLLEAEHEQMEANRSVVREAGAAVAVESLARIAASFLGGGGPCEIDELARECGVPAKELYNVLRVLEAAGFVVRSDDRWTVARPPADIRVSDVLVEWRERTSMRRNDDDDVGRAFTEAVSARFPGTVADAAGTWVSTGSSRSASPT